MSPGFAWKTISRPVLFVHIHKCAGSSISSLLPPGSYYGHNTAIMWQHPHLLGKTFFDCYKFAAVRNPYDRFLSSYNEIIKNLDQPLTDKKKWSIKATQEKEFFKPFADKTFEYFVLNCPITILSVNVFRPQHEFILLHGKLAVDKLIHFERINEEWPEVANKIHVQNTLPTINRSAHKPWEEIFTQQMRDKIYQLYWADFELLGYKK